MKPRPKFCVGEEVMMMTESCPEIRGKRTEIISMVYRDKVRPQSNGTTDVNYWAYETEFKQFPYWNETAIRKLPPEERQNWDTEIWSPIKAGEPA